MATSYFLAQVFGISYFVVGLAFIVKQKVLFEAMEAFRRNKPVPFIIGMLEFILALVLVMIHSVWSGAVFQVVLTVIIWMMLIEGFSYMFFPHGFVTWLIKIFNKQGFYVIGGLISMALGLYLAGSGFGWF